MSHQNQYLPFATGGGALVLSSSSYSALAARLSGFGDGIADPSQCNTAWRQASVVASMIGQFCADYGPNDILDDGNVAGLEANFLAALQTALIQNPAIGTPFEGVDTSSTANAAFIASLSPTLTSLANGQVLLLQKNNQDNTGAMTLKVGSASPYSILLADGTPLRASQWPANSWSAFLVQIVGGVTTFQALTPSPGLTLKLPTSAVNLYVATTGSDTNPGTSALPFLTIQGAINYILRTYAPSIYTITINVADGTYGGFTLTQGSNVAIAVTGNAVTPSNVVIAGNVGPNTTSGAAIYVGNGLSLTVSNVRVQSSTAGGFGLFAAAGASINFANLDFGNCTSTGTHIRTSGGQIVATGNYSISATANNHIYASDMGKVYTVGTTCTVSASLGVGVFANCQNFGYIAANGATYANPSNVTSGTKFTVGPLSLIYLNGAGINFFPGTTPGTTDSLGKYG